jgi:hypothetical protein
LEAKELSIHVYKSTNIEPFSQLCGQKRGDISTQQEKKGIGKVLLNADSSISDRVQDLHRHAKIFPAYVERNGGGSNAAIVSNRIKYINSLKTKGELFHLKAQFVPRSKHFSSRLYTPVSQFMSYRVEVAVCSEIHTKHINSVWAECTIFES